MTRATPSLQLRRTEPIPGPTFFRVENRWYQDHHGHEHVRSVVLHPGAVAVVPFDGERVWMIRQERVAVGKDLLEIPAGKLDVSGEEPDAAARRECAEEVGMEPGRLRLVHRFYNSPGFTDEYTYVYLAEELTPVARTPVGAEEEAAEVVDVGLDEIKAMLQADQLDDAKTLVGLLALVAHVELGW